jgi:hypothetical protein
VQSQEWVTPFDPCPFRCGASTGVTQKLRAPTSKLQQLATEPVFDVSLDAGDWEFLTATQEGLLPISFM